MKSHFRQFVEESWSGVLKKISFKHLKNSRHFKLFPSFKPHWPHHFQTFTALWAKIFYNLPKWRVWLYTSLSLRICEGNNVTKHLVISTYLFKEITVLSCFTVNAPWSVCNNFLMVIGKRVLISQRVVHLKYMLCLF